MGDAALIAQALGSGLGISHSGHRDSQPRLRLLRRAFGKSQISCVGLESVGPAPFSVFFRLPLSPRPGSQCKHGYRTQGAGAPSESTVLGDRFFSLGQSRPCGAHRRRHQRPPWVSRQEVDFHDPGQIPAQNGADDDSLVSGSFNEDSRHDPPPAPIPYTQSEKPKRESLASETRPPRS